MFQKMYLASSLLKKISSKFAFDRCVQGRTSEFWFRHSFKYKVAIPRLKSSTEWHLNYTSILVTMSAFDKIKVHISREYYFTMDFYQIKDKKIRYRGAFLQHKFPSHLKLSTFDVIDVRTRFQQGTFSLMTFSAVMDRFRRNSDIFNHCQ